MVLGTASLFTPWAIFIIAIVVVGALIFILTLVEKGLNKKLVNKRVAEHSFSNRLRKIHEFDDSPKKYLGYLDFLAREFFSEKLRVDGGATYSNLIDVFENIGDKEVSKFCERMQEAFYSGEEVDMKRLNYLTRNFSFLVEREDRKEMELERLAKKNMFNLFGNKNSQGEIKMIDSSNNREIKLDRRVVSYIDEGLRRNYKIELLRKNLEKGGFNIEEIHLAERYVRNLHSQEKNIQKSPEAIKKNVTMLNLDNPVEQVKPEIRNASNIAQEKPIEQQLPEVKSESKIIPQKNVSLIVRENENIEVPKWRSSAVQDALIKSVSEIDMNLVKIVGEGKKRGFDMSLMKSKLVERGFEERMIERAIRFVEEKDKPIMLEEKKESWFKKLFSKKKEEPIDPEVLRIVSEGKKRGFDMSLMKSKLVERGFEERMIERAIRFAGQEKSEINNHAKVKKQKFIEEVDILPFKEEDIRKKVKEVELNKRLPSLPKLPMPKVVPYKKEEIKIKRSNKPGIANNKQIGGLDDLDRLKNKISGRKEIYWKGVKDDSMS